MEADFHAAVAAGRGIAPADLVQVQNPTGRAILRARLTPVQARGQVFAPIHWTGETAPSARIDALVPPVTDPVSGQPESKAARVALRRFDAAWYGFAVSVTAPAFDSAYWALARTTAGYRAELAGQTEPGDWVEEARRLLRAPEAEALSILDAARGRARVALYHEELSLCGVTYDIELSRARYRQCALYFLCYAVVICSALDLANERGKRLGETLLGNALRSIAELDAFDLLT